MATKSKSKKTKSSRKCTNWNHIFLSIMGTILILAAVFAAINMPSAMRQKERNKAFSQLNLENKGFMQQYCDITSGADSKGPFDRTNAPAAWCWFVYGATVSETSDKMKSIAENAGWKFERDAFPEGAGREFHFKNDRGHFLIVSISSKLRDDATFNANAMNQDDSTVISMDMNAGPTNVYVYLNLSHDQL